VDDDEIESRLPPTALSACPQLKSASRIDVGGPEFANAGQDNAPIAAGRLIRSRKGARPLRQAGFSLVFVSRRGDLFAVVRQISFQHSSADLMRPVE
jgi:hypothetical protein